MKTDPFDPSPVGPHGDIYTLHVFNQLSMIKTARKPYTLLRGYSLRPPPPPLDDQLGDGSFGPILPSSITLVSKGFLATTP